jgi:MFS family permease
MSRSPASAVVPAALPAALPRSALLAYGALGLPLAMAALPVYVHVPRLYAEAAGMSLSLLGALLLGARLLDAGIDPLLGAWSDRSRRRQRLIVFALPGLAIGMLALLNPPSTAAPLWLLASLLLTYFAFSLASVAYQAWGAELGSNTGERTRLTASREGFGLLGVIVAAALPGLLSSDLAQGLSGFAKLFPLLLLLLASWTLLATPAAACRPPVRGSPPRRPRQRSRRPPLPALAAGLRAQRHRRGVAGNAGSLLRCRCPAGGRLERCLPGSLLCQRRRLPAVLGRPRAPLRACPVLAAVDARRRRLLRLGCRPRRR